jgi:hypothetical protein
MRGLQSFAAMVLAGCFALGQGDGGSSVTGRAATARGVPIAGVRVTLAAPAGGPDNLIKPLATVSTDSLGCFHVFALHAPGPGQLRVTLEGPGRAPLHLSAPVGAYSLEAARHPDEADGASFAIAAA